jgi:hypothetical protein
MTYLLYLDRLTAPQRSAALLLAALSGFALALVAYVTFGNMLVAGAVGLFSVIAVAIALYLRPGVATFQQANFPPVADIIPLLTILLSSLAPIGRETFQLPSVQIPSGGTFPRLDIQLFALALAFTIAATFPARNDARCYVIQPTNLPVCRPIALPSVATETLLDGSA